jgi:hypothetical protein
MNFWHCVCCDHRGIFVWHVWHKWTSVIVFVVTIEAYLCDICDIKLCLCQIIVVLDHRGIFVWHVWHGVTEKLPLCSYLCDLAWQKKVVYCDHRCDTNLEEVSCHSHVDNWESGNHISNFLGCYVTHTCHTWAVLSHTHITPEVVNIA